LVQVFTNIIENAIKHSPKAGEVRIAAASEKGIAKIAVSDQGAGIAPKEAQRIFERFYQIDKSRKSAAGRGTGLGLPIAKQIVEAHKGTIRVDSKPGSGSTFTVELPLTRSPHSFSVSNRIKHHGARQHHRPLLQRRKNNRKAAGGNPNAGLSDPGSGSGDRGWELDGWYTRQNSRIPSG
jgi:DNA topoisomerase VI subunit B